MFEKKPYFVVEEYFDKVTKKMLYGAFEIEGSTWRARGLYYSKDSPNSKYFKTSLIKPAFVFNDEKSAYLFMIERNKNKAKDALNQYSKFQKKQKLLEKKLANLG